MFLFYICGNVKCSAANLRRLASLRYISGTWVLHRSRDADHPTCTLLPRLWNAITVSWLFSIVAWAPILAAIFNAVWLIIESDWIGGIGLNRRAQAAQSVNKINRQEESGKSDNYFYQRKENRFECSKNTLKFYERFVGYLFPIIWRNRRNQPINH